MALFVKHLHDDELCCLGLLLGTEAPDMALNGVDFSFSFFFLNSSLTQLHLLADSVDQAAHALICSTVNNGFDIALMLYFARPSVAQIHRVPVAK